MSEHLTALFILCQGYLVTWLDPQSGKLDLPDGFPGQEKIKEAHRAMGLCRNLKFFQETLGSQEVREGKRREVCAPDWWLSLFEDIDLREKVREEWGDEDPEGLEKVIGLLEFLQTGQPLENPVLVAEAHLATHRHLTLKHY